MANRKLTKVDLAVIEKLLRWNHIGGMSVRELMEKDVPKLSKEGVLNRLKKLENSKLIKKYPAFPEHSRPVDKYKLNDDPLSFAELARRYLETYRSKYPEDWQGSVLWTFMGKDYVQGMLSTKFVKTMLGKKKAVFRQAIITENKEEKAPARDYIAANISYDTDGSLYIDDENEVVGSDSKLTDEIVEKTSIELDTKLIIPLLALISISPTALLKFLGDWKTYYDETYRTDIMASFEHVMFRLIWDTVNDISIMRNVPYERKIMYAKVGSLDPRDMYILNILFWEVQKEIRYNVEFSTQHDYYGGEEGEDIYEIERNSENVTVKVDVRDLGT